ncbi:MAG: hypothetical protein ABIJ74_04590 [archaeon]
MKKTIIFSIILFSLLFSGCTQDSSNSNQQMYVCSNGESVSNPDLCSKTIENKKTEINESIIYEEKSCPFDCCIGLEYRQKNCPSYFDCINYQCIQQDCPFECCDGTTYKFKQCSNSGICMNGTCNPKDCGVLSNSVNVSGAGCFQDAYKNCQKAKVAVNSNGCVQFIEVLSGTTQECKIKFAFDLSSPNCYNTLIPKSMKECSGLSSTCTGNVRADPEDFTSVNCEGKLFKCILNAYLSNCIKECDERNIIDKLLKSDDDCKRDCQIDYSTGIGLLT